MGDFTTKEKRDEDGITGAETRNRTVQKTALRLYSGTLTSGSEAAAKGIRLQHRAFPVWSDPSGNPGIVEKGRV